MYTDSSNILKENDLLMQLFSGKNSFSMFYLFLRKLNPSDKKYTYGRRSHGRSHNGNNLNVINVKESFVIQVV